MPRYSVSESKGNEVNRALLLPVWETIGRKTDILVGIEELEVIHRGAFWLLRVTKRRRFGKTPLLVSVQQCNLKPAEFFSD
jgi:hypothetical protein